MPVMERAMPLPKLHLREGSSPSRAGGRSPRSQRRVPSPLRNAQFRPLAMEYAEVPQPSSCKYFNGADDDEEVTQSEFCAHVRTVGYSTVGGKPFMSGKCPHCHRYVKSDNQVCTPNATPPQSPWKKTLDNLQSPLRSPLRTGSSPKNGGGSKTTTSLQSPLRSPFKGSFFGSNDDDDKRGKAAPTSPKRTAPTAAAVGPAPATRGVGLTRSPPRGGEAGSQPAPWARSRSPPPRANSPAPAPAPRASSPTPRASSPTPRASSPTPRASSPTPRANSPTPRANSPGPRSPARGNMSPSSGGAFFAVANDDGNNGGRSASGSVAARRPWAERGRSPSTRGGRGREEECVPFRGGAGGGSPTPRSRSPAAAAPRSRSPAATRSRSPAATRSRSPVPVRSPGGGVAGYSPGGGGMTRGPRSPGPRSPVRSPWKGASFFGGGNEEEEGMEPSAYSGSSSTVSTSSNGSSGSSKYMAAKSRGAHSPGPNGPRSPLRVKVDFVDQQEAEEEEERAAAAAAAASSKQANGGWKSPLKSPFKGLFFGGGSSPKKDAQAGGVTIGTE